MKRFLQGLPRPSGRSVLTFFVGMGAAAIVLLLVVAIFTSATKSTEIRDQQEENSPLIKTTAQTLKRIRDCTTPGRPCYERGQRQLAGAVNNINRVIVLASACASGPDKRTPAAIERCVVRRLARPNR